MKNLTAEAWYTIASADGRLLEAANRDGANGGEVTLLTPRGADTQVWKAAEVREGAYRLVNKQTGKVLDVISGGTENGAWLHQWENVGAESQLWSLEQGKNGVKVRSCASGKVMDIVGMATTEGAHVQLWEDVNGEAQLWSFAEVKESAAKTKTIKAAQKAAEIVEAAVNESKSAVKKAAQSPRVKKAVKAAQGAALEVAEAAKKATQTPEAAKAAAAMKQAGVELGTAASETAKEAKDVLEKAMGPEMTEKAKKTMETLETAAEAAAQETVKAVRSVAKTAKEKAAARKKGQK